MPVPLGVKTDQRVKSFLWHFTHLLLQGYGDYFIPIEFYGICEDQREKAESGKEQPFCRQECLSSKAAPSGVTSHVTFHWLQGR